MKATVNETETTLAGVSCESRVTPVTLEQLESDLSKVYRVAPFSEAALDVFEMTRRTRYGAEQIAAAIQRAPWLSADVLARSNSSFYNPSGEKITDLSLAVARIGQKRVGELALFSNTLLPKAKHSLEWMDPELAWYRSLAAGVAVEYLVDQGDHYQMDEGLTLAATMHLSGRAALGSLYPRHYVRLIERCCEESIPLLVAERSVFPENHAQVLAQLLKQWRIPAEVHAPLAHSPESYAELAKLPEPLRTRAELLKIAAAVGALASGRWQLWDLVDLPPFTVLRRLGIHDLTKVVERTERDAMAIASFGQTPGSRRKKRPGRFSRSRNSRIVRYLNLSKEADDVVRILLDSVSELPIDTVEASEALPESAVINCLGATAETLRRVGCLPPSSRHAILCDTGNAEEFSNYRMLIPLPCSFGALHSGCLKCATARVEK